MIPLKVTAEVVACHDTGLKRYARVNGRKPIWHIAYYDCPYCDDVTPADQIDFELADGSGIRFLISGDKLMWKRADWQAPRGTVLTELIRSSPCPKGQHQWWRWRFMRENELALLEPVEIEGQP